MKSCYNSLFLVFSSFFVSSLFTAEMMSPSASLLFRLAEEKKWNSFHIELMNKFLPKRPDGTDFADENGLTLLHLAVQDDQKDNVKLLLRMGACVVTHHFFEKNGAVIIVPTPLHDAVRLGYIEIAKQLMKKDPDSVRSKRCNFDNTPLHLAAWFGRSDMINLLLDKGAAITAKNSEGSTPIHMAVWTKHENCVKDLLVADKPDTLTAAKTTNNNNYSPLALAKITKNDSIEKILLLYLYSQLNADQFIDYIDNHKKFDQSQTVLIMGNTMERPSILN